MGACHVFEVGKGVGMVQCFMNHAKELRSLSFMKCGISKGLKQSYSLREITLLAQKKELCDREPKT